jgi:hypothetical protein
LSDLILWKTITTLHMFIFFINLAIPTLNPIGICTSEVFT